MRDRLIDIARGAALITQTRMEYRIIVGVYEYLPNKTLSMVGAELAKLIGGTPFTPEDQQFGKSILENMGKQIQGEVYSSKVTTPYFSKTFRDDILCVGASMDVNYSWRVSPVKFATATFGTDTPFHSWITVCQTGTSPSLKAGLHVSNPWLQQVSNVWPIQSLSRMHGNGQL
jgi:aminobenzoyl-glutamate utilization protein B